MTDWDDPIQAQVEPEAMMARRAFPVSQQLLGGATVEVAAESLNVGWHGTDLHPENGATALVDPAGDYAGLVGEILCLTRLERGGRSIYVYVIGSAKLDADVDISVSRRAFLGIGILASEFVAAKAEVVG